MSVLRLSGFVLSLLLLASLSALVSPASSANKPLMESDFPVVTGQGAMHGGVVRKELANNELVAREAVERSVPATEIIPFTGVNVPEMGQ